MREAPPVGALSEILGAVGGGVAEGDEREESLSLVLGSGRGSKEAFACFLPECERVAVRIARSVAEADVVMV